MEPNEIQTRLAEAVEEVLETMCFTSVLASGEGAAPSDGDTAAPASRDGAVLAMAESADGGGLPASGEGAAEGRENAAEPADGLGASPVGGNVASGERAVSADENGGARGASPVGGNVARGERAVSADENGGARGASPVGGNGALPVGGERAVSTGENGGAPACTAELRFHGNPSGGFRVRVPWKLARVVGAGFLGREETEVSDSQAEEVVCELANMICGSVLSRLESKATFQITHPEPGRPERDAGFDGAGASRWFDLGDGILTVSLELQRTL